MRANSSARVAHARRRGSVYDGEREMFVCLKRTHVGVCGVCKGLPSLRVCVHASPSRSCHRYICVHACAYLSLSLREHILARCGGDFYRLSLLCNSADLPSDLIDPPHRLLTGNHVAPLSPFEVKVYGCTPEPHSHARIRTYNEASSGPRGSPAASSSPLSPPRHFEVFLH